MSPTVKASLGAVGAGVLGALLWGVVAYLTHREIGWLAWIVGVLIGFGVRLCAGEHDGPKYGLIALAGVLLSLPLGKYLAVAFVVSSLQSKLDEIKVTITDEDMIASYTDAVAEEWRLARRHPYATQDPSDILKKNYAPAVRQEGQRRWQALPATEKQNRLAQRTAELEKAKKEFGGKARSGAFAASFSPWDILWFLLAGLSAFKIGSGLVSDD